MSLAASRTPRPWFPGPLAVALLITTFVVAALLGAQRIDPLRHGLLATYHEETDSAARRLSTIDADPSLESAYLAWERHPPRRYRVTWNGSLLVVSGGAQVFSVTGNQPTTLQIDGRPCVRLDGQQFQIASCTVGLDRGAHFIEIEFSRRDEDASLSISWGRAGRVLHPLAKRDLASGHVTPRRLVIDEVMGWAIAVAESLWCVLLLAWCAWRGRSRIGHLVARVRADRSLQALCLVSLGSMVLNGVGIWCGLPQRQGWLGDEIGPATVLDGLAHRFSGGWPNWYPLVHFYVLAVCYSPVLFLQWLGQADVSKAPWHDVLYAINRAVVFVEAIGVLIAVYAAASIAAGKRAGVAAAACVSLLVLFVAYSKVGNIEIPYVFWFAISLVFYLRFIRTPTVRDAAWFALAGGLAISTKDQAYGLFLLTPFVLLSAVRRDRVLRSPDEPFVRSLIDKRLLAAAAALIVAVSVGNNLLFNWAGVMARLDFLSTGGRMVHDFNPLDPMPERRLRLLVQSVGLLRNSWGWPLMVVGTAGWVLGLVSRPTRRWAVALTVMALSYYLFFINAVMYCYDRFLLPICLMQAIFAGYALDRWLSLPAGRPWRRLVVAAVFCYSLLYAATIDVLMVRDSRGVVERWLQERVAPGTVVGVSFVPRLLPPLEGFRAVEFANPEDVAAIHPPYFVFDQDYARAVDPATPLGQVIGGLQDGRLGYERAWQYRAPLPWPWLPGAHPELTHPREGERVTSSLSDVNPTFVVYQRR